MLQHSNVVSSTGLGTVWKWSKTQMESQPPLSAWRATLVIASYFSTGSRISTKSIVQPWGTNTPNLTAVPEGTLMSLPPPASRPFDPFELKTTQQHPSNPASKQDMCPFGNYEL